MLDFLKYFIPFALVMMLVLAGMFVFSGMTGRSCLACEAGTAPMVNFSNPSAADVDSIIFEALLIIFAPLGGLVIFGLLVLAIRVTASSKARSDARTAREIGEDGVGPWLFGNDK